MAADPSTLPTLLRHNSQQRGDQQALVTETGSLTHAQLDLESTRLARRLMRAGVGTSSRVGLLMENGIDWAVVATAIMRCGAVLVPLSTLLKPRELQGQLGTATVTELIATRAFRGRNYLSELESIAPGLRERIAGGGRHPELPSLRGLWPADELPSQAVNEAIVAAAGANVHPADDLVILFTSGSRSTPKGVVHTHGGAIRATASGLASRCIGPDDRLYIPMPFFWTGGFSSGLMTALVAGATLITEAVPRPEATLRLLARERVTLFRGWPDQAARLAADPMFAHADLSHLGPGSLPAVLPLAARPAPGALANLFGMTETFGPYCGARLDTDLPPEKFGSCGRPFDGVEVKIFDTESGDECAAGADGEIGVRGPNVMRAICGRSREATFDPDGFYHTGDLGRMDRDGYLWYRGRRDDMFKVRGATVYPSEVEDALRHVQGVRQAFVTDLPGPDGAEVGALVVTDLGPEDVDAAVRIHLSSFKVPSVWYVTDRMDVVPRLASDKVSKTGLQEMIRTAGVRSDRGSRSAELAEKGTVE